MKEFKLPFREAKVGAYTGELALCLYPGENNASLDHVSEGHRYRTLIATINAEGLREAAKLFTELAEKLD